jgi:hypothetical protein
MSDHLFSMMKEEKLLKYFQLECIDGNRNIPRDFITPMIIIKNIPDPYIGKDVFAWLAKIKQYKITYTINKVGNDQQKYLNSLNNNLSTEYSNIIGFSKEEMDGVSDMFSFTGTDDAIIHSQMPYECIGESSILTPEIESNKIDINTHNRLKKKLESERKDQDAKLKQGMEQFRSTYRK